ncbi:MAG: hypothetical protein L0Z62_41115 [Gemmataceae bacterium]|nr:hypothetical protein [Gemmataceae bacterium]
MKPKGKKKQLDFTVRPRAAREELPAEADRWVLEGKGAGDGPHKRLTLNLPAALHAAFKSRCAIESATIQDKVRALIERELAQATRPPEPPAEQR